VRFHQLQLANGLQIVGETNPAARSVAVGFFVKTGSRDEPGELAGVTHFLEHMVFKGTERRNAFQVNRDFDAVGAHPNAYTSEENTVFHATCLPEYLPQVIEILADILRPSLREEDFETEKQVILEEIGMYNDQPSYSAYEAAKAAFFQGHPLAGSVLGSRESIRALTRAQMWEYFLQRYVANNIVASVAGNFDWDSLVGLVQNHCGHWKPGNASRKVQPWRGNESFQVVARDAVAQEHTFLISPGPPVDDELRYAAKILATVVGDETGSRLYWALVDPGKVDVADTDYQGYEGTGAFFTYLSGEPEKFPESLQIARKVLKHVQAEGITEEELETAKSKLGSRIVRGSERPMGRMQAIGYYWTYLKKYRSVDEELEAIDRVTTKDVEKVLATYPLDRMTAVALGPLSQVDW
jgi:predicted Zn-dependent peptidase